MSILKSLPWWRLLRYNAVGALTVSLKLGTLTALQECTDFGYLLSTAASVELAIIHGFVWHHCWTWGDRRAGVGAGALAVRLLRYNLLNGNLALCSNLLVMQLLVGEWGIHYLLAGIAATAVAGITNYLLSDWAVFRAPLRVLPLAAPERTALSQ